MKVLVTGAGGFIGCNVARLLEKRGIETVLLDNFYSSNFGNIMDLKGELIVADITDEGAFKKLPKVDAVIHEAAITDTTLDDDNLMLRVNFEGFKNALRYCLEKNIKLVYASSAGTYGDGIMPAKEDQAPKPLNTYAFSKYLCDRTFLKLVQTRKDLPVVGLRYFNVYGPREFHKAKAASMTYQLYLQMIQGKRPRIFTNGEQKRDFIYVKDVAEITVEALKLKVPAILNVGTGQARDFNEMIEILNKNLNTRLAPDYFDNPYKGLYQDYTVADVTNLQDKLKLQAKYSLEAGIKDYVEMLKG